MRFPIFELKRTRSLFENTVKYNLTGLADWLRTKKSVFILAGDCYGMDHYFRIGIGAEKNYLMAGLDRVRSVLAGRSGIQEHSQ